MGQGTCGRMAAALTIALLGLSPVLAMDWGGPPPSADPNSDSNSNGVPFARPCPTRFDYLVLASLADAPSLLGLSTYHFRSEPGFSAVPLAGALPGDYEADSSAIDCRTKGADSR